MYVNSSGAKTLSQWNLKSNTQCVSRTFSGQVKFLKIKALQKILNLKNTKERHRRETFFLAILKGTLMQV